MNLRNSLKKGNSKGKLANAIILYGRALEHYANESNWAVKGDDIIWLGDDDPTYAADVTLGKRKPDSKYKPHNVRLPDINKEPSSATNPTDKPTAT